MVDVTPACLRPSRRGRATAWLALVACAAIACSTPVTAGEQSFDFTLHKHVGEAPGRTLLVVGGIQGDEPGGFNAASLLVTHYRLANGSLWVVPNLNFESIIKRSRGVHGDLNRKFPSVAENDPDYDRVEKIKAIIRDRRVSYVFNLHDGSGFYRARRIDANHGPRRWGQSIIIDQEDFDDAEHGKLGELARAVTAQVNENLVDDDHVFGVKNTRTREGDVEMAKTLTYFAINNGRAAVGIEASKSLPTHLRVYYHLQALEAYMERLGLEYDRSFELSPAGVKDAVDNNVKVAFYGDRLFLDMANARNRLGYVPLQKGTALEFEASSPLVAIMRSGETFRVRYGNRRVTELSPQRFDYDWSRHELPMTLDDEARSIAIGSLVEVRDRFRVEPMSGYRVNVIGWRKPGGGDESGSVLRRSDIATRFSVDQAGTTFRVEVYRGKRFTGMVLVRFSDEPSARVQRVNEDLS